jgi:hypothetical protein
MEEMRILGLCLIVASGCGGDDGGGDAAVGTTAHQFCVQETNRYRQMNGVAAVAESTPLENYANTGAMVDFAAAPHDHFRTTNGGGIAFAENECPHWDVNGQGHGDMSMLVAACIAAFYAEGPGTDYATHGHYINMMNASYTTLGCGLYQSGTAVTIVQDYGN